MLVDELIKTELC